MEFVMEKVDVIGPGGQPWGNDIVFVRTPALGEWVRLQSGQWAKVIIVAHRPGIAAEVTIQLGSPANQPS
jgi:hypothetical protein